MWPNELLELKHIEQLLTCGICYDYIDTSMVTTCSHNCKSFCEDCSLCIRSYLHYKTQCPICFEETFEKDLRKNQVLDKILVEYLTVKDKLRKRLLVEETETAKNDELNTVWSFNDLNYKKETEIPGITEMPLEDSNSSVSSQNTASVSTPRVERNYQQIISSPSTSKSLKIPSMFTPKSKKSFRNDEKAVICPICKVDVPQRNINKHLDDCLKRQNTKDQPKKIGRKPLPKLVLSLMNVSAIRKKLKELGLQSQGDRKILENRLQKYIILYNAECDKTNPRPVSELIKQCEEEENLGKKTQKTFNKLNINRNTDHNIIEQQRKKYLAENKDSFGQLIAKIKNVDSPQKLPVRRNILNYENTNSQETDVKSSLIVKNNRETDFTQVNSFDPYINDSSSNTTCPLQMYSSEDPMNFLTIELSSSSVSNRSASNENVPKAPCDTNSLSFNFAIKTENIKTESLSSEVHSVHEDVISNSPNSAAQISRTRKRSVSEKETNIQAQETYFDLTTNESKSRKETRLSAKKRCSQEKDDANPDSINKPDKELYDKVTDSILDNVECVIMDTNNIDNQLDYKESMHGQSYKMKEEYATVCTVFEKENVKFPDDNRTDRKREHNTTFVRSDESKNGDRSTGRKPVRFGLSETNEFNYEDCGENVLQNEEVLRSKKPRLRPTREKKTDSPAKRYATSKSDKSKTAAKITRRINVK